MKNFVMSAQEETMLETLLNAGLSYQAAKTAIVAQRQEQAQPTEAAATAEKHDNVFSIVKEPQKIETPSDEEEVVAETIYPVEEELDTLLQQEEEEFLYEVTEQQKKGYFYNLCSEIVSAARPVQRTALKRALNKEGVKLLSCDKGTCRLEYKRGHNFIATLAYNTENGKILKGSTKVMVEWNTEILETEAKKMVSGHTGVDFNEVEQDGNVFFASNSILEEKLAAKAEVMNNGIIKLTHSHDINDVDEIVKRERKQKQNAKEVYEFIKNNLFNAILTSDMMKNVKAEDLPTALSLHTIALIEKGQVIFINESNISLFELNMKTKGLQLVAKDLNILEESGTQVRYEKVLVDEDGNEIETSGSMLAPGTFTQVVNKERVIELGERAFSTFMTNHHMSVLSNKKGFKGTNLSLVLGNEDEEFEFEITTADSAKQRGLVELIS